MTPTTRSVATLALGLVFAALPIFLGPAAWIAWIVYLSGSAAVIALDAILALRAHALRLVANSPSTIFIGESESLTLTLRCSSPNATARFEAQLELNEILTPTAIETASLAEGSASFEWALRPVRRGKAHVYGVWLRWQSPFGLIALTKRIALEREIAVIPNLREARQTALRYFSARDANLGLKTERFVGEGSEFESLQQFRAGMDSRSIDWKASARHRSLLARRFRAERNHQVILAIDTGHLMREPIDGIPRVDHAVTRALALSYYSLRSGDRVGLFAFGAEPRFYVEPRGGNEAFGRLRERSADIEYGTGETNFTRGILELTQRLARRSLVIVFTEFVDTVTAELMVQNLDRLAKRHVVLFVAMRDPALEAVELDMPRQALDISRSVVAHGIREDRERVLHKLARNGIHVIDCVPEALSAALINKYMSIKRRELV